MDTISDEQRRVLKRLDKGSPMNAEHLKCSIRTLMALERRGLITVETSFNAIAYPRRAMAWVKPAGIMALMRRRRKAA